MQFNNSMNYDFLQAYTLPRSISSLPSCNSSITCSSSSSSGGGGGGGGGGVVFLHQEVQQIDNQFPCNGRTEQPPWSSGAAGTSALPQKRKYAAGPGQLTHAQPSLVDAADDGGLVLFVGRDESYPDALNRLIHPLKCDLCNAIMNSLPSAKDHYKSKPHDRNITAWLNKNYTEKGLSPPAVKRFLTKGPCGPQAFHCKLCDLQLTSLTHANQHYAGRKHRLVASNISKPSGAGYYTDDGEWIRTATKHQARDVDDGRFGIGVAFKTTLPATAPDKAIPTEGECPTDNGARSVTSQTSNEETKTLHCDVCKVNTTSLIQMEMHYAGVKHRKKLQLVTVESDLAATNPPRIPTGAISVLAASLNESSEKSADLSTYRTPTGSYYCKTCDLTVPNASTLQQHILGKKHLRRTAEENCNVPPVGPTQAAPTATRASASAPAAARK